MTPGGRVDLRYLEVNPAFERHTGLKRSDILGRTTLELFPDAESALVRAVTAQVATTGVSDAFPSEVRAVESLV